jgi:hypothetical protein
MIVGSGRHPSREHQARGGGSHARRLAQAESDYSELAILTSVADAVTLTVEYLGGAPLREINVPRLPPPWGSPEPEPGMD